MNREDMRQREELAGLVLAGGLGRRVGRRHKAFLELGGKPLIAHVMERLQPQVRHVAISANAEAERLREHADVVLPDVVPGHAGPLAGILSGLQWLRQEHPRVHWLLSVAVDTPFLPRDLGHRLLAAARDSRSVVAVAQSCGRLHPVCALWHQDVMAPLEMALQQERNLSMKQFLQAWHVVEVAFDADEVDPFFNINTSAELTRARELLGKVERVRVAEGREQA